MTDLILHTWFQLKGRNRVERFKRRKLPVRQSKRMGSYADNSFATTSYSLDEGRSQTSRRSIHRRKLVSTLNQLTRMETYNDSMVRVEKVLTESVTQR